MHPTRRRVSTSGGRLVLTRRLVLAIAHLSNPGDPRRQRFYVRIQLSVGQRAVNIAVGLSLDLPSSLPSPAGFQRPVSADESRKPSHRAATGDHPDPHLPLRNDGLFATAKTHVAGERDLAAVAGRPAADEGNGNDWQAGQTHRESPAMAASLWAQAVVGQLLELGR